MSSCEQCTDDKRKGSRRSRCNDSRGCSLRDQKDQSGSQERCGKGGKGVEEHGEADATKADTEQRDAGGRGGQAVETVYTADGKYMGKHAD